MTILTAQPTIQPTASELLNACALLVSENEQLRGNAGTSSSIYGRRDFSPDDLRRGHDLTPTACFRDGTLVVKIDT